MINGKNARLVILMLFAIVIVLIVSITLLTVEGDAVPMILSNTLTTVVGIIIGAFGINATIQKDSTNNVPNKDKG